MILPPHAIEEFRALWKAHYGVELSPAEGKERALSFLEAMARLLQGVDHSLLSTETLLTDNPPKSVNEGIES